MTQQAWLLAKRRCVSGYVVGLVNTQHMHPLTVCSQNSGLESAPGGFHDDGHI